MPRKRRENPNETNQPCPKCGAHLYRRNVQVVRGSCWSCHRSMPIAFGYDGVTMMSPTEFTPPELDAATRAGAVLREHFSKTTQTQYLANTCEGCGTFCGDFYLHEFWEEEPMSPAAEVVLGCLECFAAVRTTPAADGSIWTGVIPHEEDDEVDDLPLPTPTAKKAPPKTEKGRSLPIAPPALKAAPVWGRCSQCGASACPATLNDGKFFCGQCRAIRRFVPDLL